MRLTPLLSLPWIPSLFSAELYALLVAGTGGIALVDALCFPKLGDGMMREKGDKYHRLRERKDAAFCSITLEFCPRRKSFNSLYW